MISQLVSACLPHDMPVICHFQLSLITLKMSARYPFEPTMGYLKSRKNMTMNYVSFAENKTSQSDLTMKYATTRFASARSNAASERWCMSILIIVVGLPALMFFLAIGGMFALVGPWVILSGIQAARKRPGWQVLGIITGGGFLFLGATALLLPIHAGCLDLMCGVAVLLLGLGYLAITLFMMRKTF